MQNIADKCIINVMSGWTAIGEVLDLWLFIQITDQNHNNLLRNKAPMSHAACSIINPGLWNNTFKEKDLLKNQSVR